MDIKLTSDFNFKDFDKNGKARVKRAMPACGKIIVDEIKKQISTPGYGKPSYPGTPPHLQTGIMHDSVKFEIMDRTYNTIGVYFDGSGFYWEFHEFGSSKHPRRPFLTAALSEAHPKILDRISQSMGIRNANIQQSRLE